MKPILSFCVLVLALTSISCAKKRITPATGGGTPNDGKVDTAPSKNPTSVPAMGNIERTLVGNVLVGSYFESGLQNLGIYTPDVCFQYVTIKDKSKNTSANYLELSSVPCPGGSSLIDNSDILLRVDVKQHPQYFTQFHVRSNDRNLNLGIFRQLTLNDVSSFVMEGLCEIDPYGWNKELTFTNTCAINVDGSLFGKPALFVD